MLIVIIAVAVFIGLLLLARSVGLLAFTVVRECGAIQSAVKNQGEQVATARADVLAELEFVRGQLADYLGNELLEKRVLPAVGYREPTDPVKQLISAAVTKEFF
jgi:hypothetical protein